MDTNFEKQLLLSSDFRTEQKSVHFNKYSYNNNLVMARATYMSENQIVPMWKGLPGGAPF